MNSTQHLQNQIDRLYRRILMTVAPVKITATDDEGPIHRIQGRVQGTPETIDDMGVMQIYGLASHAPVGTDATAMFVGGDRANTVIIATGNQKYRLRGLKSGEVALYSDEGDFVKFRRGKIIEVKAQEELKIETKKLTIQSDEIAIKGNIELDGNLSATGRVNWSATGGGGPSAQDEDRTRE
jgi:phage baseplate assembly protein V